MSSAPTRSQAVVIVTTAAQIRAIVGEEVERAVGRALAGQAEREEDSKEWIPTKRAERVYGRSRTTLYRWARAGKIRSMKIGGSVYFLPPGH